ncbi:hypothetical protein [Nguyenibacter vanlangensis]|uniref:Uncharacterized protein n=1 Tax=Nguyenibacter vanlangensis TaxID=1216886 RepID=A0A7Y7ISX7_9PROT|nr:hypothetical protein [Nguyenibacter vanlangensis]NVN09769.1 hypothetical protein [Nguyenibacter vanlangensis]
MTGLVLRAATYRRSGYPFGGVSASPLAGAVSDLARLLAQDAREAMTATGVAPDHVFVTSTIMSPRVTEPGPEQHAVTRALAEATGCTPLLINAYECTGWGYILRHVTHLGITGPIMILIQDCDVHNFTFWRRNDAWGNSGFGITTLIIDVGAGAAADVSVDAVPKAGALRNFRKALGVFTAAKPAQVVSTPFFPEATRKGFRATSHLPNECADRHGEYGHSFGSDPWIGLIEACAGARPATAIVGSLALNGYHAIAHITLSPNAVIELHNSAAADKTSPQTAI